MSNDASDDFIAFPPKPWPKDVPRTKGLVRQFLEEQKQAFDADPFATFCAGEFDGVVLVVANGEKAAQLRAIVRHEWVGVVEQMPTSEPLPSSEPPLV